MKINSYVTGLHAQSLEVQHLLERAKTDPSVSPMSFIELVATNLHMSRTIALMAHDADQPPDYAETRIAYKVKVAELWHEYFQLESDLFRDMSKLAETRTAHSL
jgi:hypothetical protein